MKARFSGQLEIVSHLAQQILVDNEVVDMPGFIGCQAGRGQGCVTANGTVLPCVLLPVPLGNIREARFRDIWQGSPIVKLLQDRDNLRGKCAGAPYARAVAAAEPSPSPRPAISSPPIPAAGCRMAHQLLTTCTKPRETTMAQVAEAFDPQEIVNRYFEYIRELRHGKQEAVDKLIGLWNEDGVFELQARSRSPGRTRGGMRFTCSIRTV